MVLFEKLYDPLLIYHFQLVIGLFAGTELSVKQITSPWQSGRLEKEAVGRFEIVNGIIVVSEHLF